MSRGGLLALGGILVGVVLGGTAVAGDLGNQQSVRTGLVSTTSFRVFIALENAGSVAIVSGPPWRLRRRVAVAAGPHNLEASRDGRYVAVTSPPSNTVTIIRTADDKVVASAHVGGSPHDLAFTLDSKRLWVTVEHGRRLVELSVPWGEMLRSTDADGSPHDLAISPSGRELWDTIDGSPRVQIRLASTGRLLADPLVGGAPHDLSFAPGGRSVWLSNVSSGQLAVVATRSRLRVRTINAGVEPHHFAFGLGCLWASDNGGGVLLRIDPTVGRVRSRTAVGSAPHHVAIAGGEVLVAVHGTGDMAVVSPRGKLSLKLRVGAGPHGIAAVPVTRRGRAARAAHGCSSPG